MNLLRRLINCIRKLLYKEIPFDISDNELIVRGVVHPMFYSGNKLKEGAFLPPRDKTDVSVLRKDYTNDDFCKQHAKGLKIGDSTYCGMATILAKHINDVVIDTGNLINVIIKGTPIDSNSQYVDTPPVFVNSKGLPMHADIIYEEPLIKGEPNTKHRKVAKKLASIANYFSDNNPESDNWSGIPLRWGHN